MKIDPRLDKQEKPPWQDDPVILSRLMIAGIGVLVFSLLTAVFGLG